MIKWAPVTLAGALSPRHSRLMEAFDRKRARPRAARRAKSALRVRANIRRNLGLNQTEDRVVKSCKDESWINSVVLIVEDDPILRMGAVATVEEAYCKVYLAPNADEALRLLKIHSDMTLMFADIDMRGTMDGLELAEVVHAKWPHIRLLVTSGHTMMAGRRDQMRSRLPWLTSQRPFRRANSSVAQTVASPTRSCSSAP